MNNITASTPYPIARLRECESGGRYAIATFGKTVILAFLMSIKVHKSEIQRHFVDLKHFIDNEVIFRLMSDVKACKQRFL